MVIVKLIGGLGNQLFQYALGRKIALIHNVPLELDISAFESYKLRKYGLNHFNIVADIATPEDMASLKNNNGIGGLMTLIVERFQPYYRRSVVSERFLHYDPNILKVSGNVYLEGYWGTEKYFKDIETVIRQELTVKTKPAELNVSMAEHIRQLPAVGMHIRCGDFISDSATHQFHGMCSLDYYHDAADMIARMVEKPHFFIFSDDPQWAQDNLKVKYPVTFVTHNSSDEDYEDLRLMSLCRYHIIANSTFGWWGAWLNTAPDKIVIAPRKWLNDSRIDTRDVLPDSWIKL